MFTMLFTGLRIFLRLLERLSFYVSSCIRVHNARITNLLHCNRVCISSRFRDNRPQTFWGLYVDLSRSRDVIDQVTNRFAIGYFLLVVHCNQVSISKCFRDNRP